MYVSNERRKCLDVNRLVMSVSLDNRIRLSRVAVHAQVVQAAAKLRDIDGAGRVQIEHVERIGKVEHGSGCLRNVVARLVPPSLLFDGMQLVTHVIDRISDVLVKVALRLREEGSSRPVMGRSHAQGFVRAGGARERSGGTHFESIAHSIEGVVSGDALVELRGVDLAKVAHAAKWLIMLADSADPTLAAWAELATAEQWS